MNDVPVCFIYGMGDIWLSFFALSYEVDGFLHVLNIYNSGMSDICRQGLLKAKQKVKRWTILFFLSTRHDRSVMPSDSVSMSMTVPSLF